jgi:glycosyl transferase, family 25
MKALVINLDSAKDRLEFQQEQLSDLGISYERISAVCVASLSNEDYEKDAYSWQRQLRRVEVACFRSHFAAWKRVKELGEPCLILEDDALLCHKTASLLGAVGIIFRWSRGSERRS